MNFRSFYRPTILGAVCAAMLGLAVSPAAAQATARDADVVTSPGDATLWIAPSERVSLGLGQRTITSIPSFTRVDASVPTLGLGVRLSPSAMLTWESDTKALRSHQSWIDSDQHRVGLSFRSKHQASDMRSLLTVQLSGQSALHLRPRSGGLRVSYKLDF